MSDENPEATDGLPEDSPDMAAFEAALADQSDGDQPDPVLVDLERAKEDLARARADLFNLNQEYGNYVRRAKEAAVVQRVSGQADVAEALLSVLDDIEAARQAGDLEGPFAAIATKLEETLAGRLGLERFGAPGDLFDPEIHEALMAQSKPDIDQPLVGQVLQPGYRMKERLLRATKVVVDNPE